MFLYSQIINNIVTGLGYCKMKQDYNTTRIYKELQYPVLGRHKPNRAGFFVFNTFPKGYFEISDSFLRRENNRVLFHMTEKFRASDNLNTRPVIAKANSHAYTG